MLLKELRIPFLNRPRLWCDNLSTISLASNPVFHARTKHIEVDYHFIQEKVLQKALDVQYVHTHDQLADIFTKGLHPRLQFLRSKLQVATQPISMKGAIDNR